MPSQHWITIIYHAAEIMKVEEWYPWEDIVRELALVAPRGPAIRRCEKYRVWQYQKRHPGAKEVPPRTKNISREEQYQSGARSLVREVINCEAFETRVVTLPNGTTQKQLMMRHVPRRAQLERVYRAQAEEAERQHRAAQEGDTTHDRNNRTALPSNTAHPKAVDATH